MAAVCGLTVAQTSEERDEFLRTLPRLALSELPTGDHCPICLTSFAAILQDEHTFPEQRTGVTKLQCGHVFCIADISEWIHTLRGSCPTCRDLFLVIPELSDDESSDGGEYVPGSDSVADDMIDGETWTDEDGEVWTDGEDMSFDEGITDGETDYSWERSFEEAGTDVHSNGMHATGQGLQPSFDMAIITEAGRTSSPAAPYDDISCEQIETELIQWRARIDLIQLCDWVSNKDETRSTLHQGFSALKTLKPRIDAIERDTPGNLSFVHYALGIVQELRREMESKLEMVHDVDP